VKKSDLKNLIKECVKEVIFEDGALTKIVSEVAQGMSLTPLMEKQNTRNETSRKDVRKAVREQISKTLTKRERTISTNKNPLFEGTVPIDSRENNNPGVDITSLPGIQNWGAVASRLDDK
jgi:hypothetical protein|tara:strand:+ start:277 stop:636 length:360 start_codon:yes stop_codon:yes gene_type:complete